MTKKEVKIVLHGIEVVGVFEEEDSRPRGTGDGVPSADLEEILWDEARVVEESPYKRWAEGWGWTAARYPSPGEALRVRNPRLVSNLLWEEYGR
jgi:hypothetical protein